MWTLTLEFSISSSKQSSSYETTRARNCDNECFWSLLHILKFWCCTRQHTGWNARENSFRCWCFAFSCSNDGDWCCDLMGFHALIVGPFYVQLAIRLMKAPFTSAAVDRCDMIAVALIGLMTTLSTLIAWLLVVKFTNGTQRFVCMCIHHRQFSNSILVIPLLD